MRKRVHYILEYCNFQNCKGLNSPGRHLELDRARFTGQLHRDSLVAVSDAAYEAILVSTHITK